MRRGNPTQRQGRTHLSPLPPHRRGGRHLARVAQDRVPLGQGRQATVPEDPWWASPLPGHGAPPAGRRAAGAANSLSRSVLRLLPRSCLEWVPAAPPAVGDHDRSCLPEGPPAEATAACRPCPCRTAVGHPLSRAGAATQTTSDVTLISDRRWWSAPPPS